MNKQTQDRSKQKQQTNKDAKMGQLENTIMSLDGDDESTL